MRSIVSANQEQFRTCSLFVYLKVLLIVLASGGLIACLSCEPLLQMAGDIWIVSDAVTPADAIVILGGHPTERPRMAADLYWKGLAHKIIVSQVEDEQLRQGTSHNELNRNALLKLGIPASAIGAFGVANKNTMEEALSLKDWAEENGASSLIVPAELFYARRVSWILRREFSGKAIRIEVPAFEPGDYSREEWWRTKGGVDEFKNELLKYVYYRLVY